MANNATVVVLIILFILFLTPNSQQPSLGQDALFRRVLAQENADLQILRNSTYRGFSAENQQYLNLTGLREQDGYAWNLLSTVKARVRTQLDYAWSHYSPETIPNRLETAVDGPLPIYKNVTGWLRGKWVRSELTGYHLGPHLNLSKTAPGIFTSDLMTYQRNISGIEGHVRLRLRQRDATVSSFHNGTVTDISASMTIQDESSHGDGWDLKLFGVEFQDFGGMILTTTSEKFSGIYALPHLALSEHTYLLSQHLLNLTLAETMNQQHSGEEKSLKPWAAADSESILPQCEYVVYLQQWPLKESEPDEPHQTILESSKLMQMLENELRFPTGRPSFPVPPMKMSMLIYSPDCGFVLESKGPPDYAAQEGSHLIGSKLEAYMDTVKTYLLLFVLLLAFQSLLLIRQMKESSTPSTKSRISFYTMAAMSMGDAFTWVIFLTTAFFVDAFFINMVMVAFFAFLSGSFFGMKFMMDVWNIQEPERIEAQRRQQRQSETSLRSGTNATGALPTNAAQTLQTASQPRPAAEHALPLPVTARRSFDSGATPIILPPDQADPAEPTNVPQASRTSFGALYTRIYFLLLLIIFLSINAFNSWPPFLRSLYTNLLAFIYLSCWIPQIYRNIIRNCHRALSWTFVFGQSALRPLPFIYLWGVEDNVLFVRTDRHVMFGLIGWVWLQCLVLLAQEILGPRFCVSTKWSWVPPAWEYHPILREDEEGATLPIGFSQARDEAGVSTVSGGEVDPKGAGSTGKGKKVFDCAICQQDLEVPVVPAGGASAKDDGAASSMSSFLARRAYMVTPCRHIFHTQCLEDWMKIRLSCAICRESLPSL